MNKKEEKTNELILAALERLLEKKSYTDISVSDIILESTVSRSTFYAHYKKNNGSEEQSLPKQAQGTELDAQNIDTKMSSDDYFNRV